MARRPVDVGGRGAGALGCVVLCALALAGFAGSFGWSGVESAPMAAVWRVDVNSASAAELSVLPGIGPSLAGRIVELRDLRGGFERFEELDDVRGIGAKRLAGVRPFVRVGPGG